MPNTPFTRSGIPSALLGLALLAAPTAQAEMYRWVDQDGVTVYSEHPPPDAEATRIRKDSAPSSVDTNRALDRINRFNTQDFDRREEAKKQAEEAAAAAEETAGRKHNCEMARRNLETIQTLGARRLRMPNGEYRVVSDDDRARLESESRKLIQENCK